MRLTKISLVGFFVLAISASGSAQGPIVWMRDIDQAKQLAQRDQRLVLLHFYADWCGPCRTLDRAVFPHPDVGRSIAANYVAVKIDVDRNQALAKRYDVSQIPADVIIDAQGRVVFQTKSPADPSQYSQLLSRVASNGRGASSAQAASARMPQPSQSTLPATHNSWDAPWSSQATNTGRGVQPPTNTTVTAGYDARSAWQGGTRSETTGSYLGSRQATWAQSGPGHADQRVVGEPDARPAGPSSSSWYAEKMTYGAQANMGIRNPNSPPLQDGAPGHGSTGLANRWGQTNPYVDAQTAMPADSQVAGRSQIATAERHMAITAGGFSGDTILNPHATQPKGDAGPSTPQQPPADASAMNSPLALDGYCPVTLAESERWAKGDVMWGARHRGRTYLFVSEQQKQRFMADPDRYSPVLSGYDPTRYVDSGEAVSGQRRHGMWFRGKIYLFADEDSLRRFSLSPEYYSQKAYEIMMTSGR